MKTELNHQKQANIITFLERRLILMFIWQDVELLLRFFISIINWDIMLVRPYNLDTIEPKFDIVKRGLT